MDSVQEIYKKLDPPLESFDPGQLGSSFDQELNVVSHLWFVCGYRPGISAYLNFFLLKDFIVTHDTSYPPRFQSFKSMADSFYQTDLFIRDVTDSGLKATGGISNPKVYKLLTQIMARHKNVSIPIWMMTYFGYSLLETVEKQAGAMSPEDKQLHLQYMAKTYRLMGMPFSSDRETMDRFARAVEAEYAGVSPHVEKHARNILILGEMAGVPSGYDSISPFLPEGTRKVYQTFAKRVEPSWLKRKGARLLGRLLLKQAIGAPRQAIRWNQATN